MPRPKHAVAIEAGALCLFLCLLCTCLYRLAASLQDRWGLAWCALAAGIGWLAADFASGLVHWFADTFFEEDTPCIGPLLIQPFREHHRDPQAMTHHGFLELTGNSCLMLLPVVGAALALPLSPASQAAVMAFALGLFATNLFHKWAHDAAPPAFVPLAARSLAHPAARASPASPQRAATTPPIASPPAGPTPSPKPAARSSRCTALLVWLRVPVARHQT